jgi:hypothetical protein
MSCHPQPQGPPGPDSVVGKETQNRNKFNAVSHTLVHSTLSSPPSFRPVVIPAVPSFLSLHTYTNRALPSPPSIPSTPKSLMLLTSLAFLVCASAPAFAQQVSYDAAHNVTPITGTWCSGSMNVMTGAVRMFVHFTVAPIHYRELV